MTKYQMALSLSSALLASATLWALLSSPSFDTNPKPSTETKSLENSNAPEPLRELPPRTSLSETVERSLFSPRRRAPEKPSLARAERMEADNNTAPSTPNLDEVLRLAGIVAGEGRSVALFENMSNTENISLSVGDTYQGWTLRTIEETFVTLSNENSNETITFPRINLINDPSEETSMQSRLSNPASSLRTLQRK